MMKKMILECLVVILLCSLAKSSECPANFPIEVQGKCYRLQFDPLSFGDARDNCLKLGGSITSIREPELMDVIQKLILEYLIEKLDKAIFWIGIKMGDKSLLKDAGDRTWTVDFDESEFIQKEYPMWATEGGPTDKGLTCGAVNASNDYMVSAVDCGGPRLLVICMMKEGERCQDDLKSYMQYGPHCIYAETKGATEYKYLHGICHPHVPTPVKNTDMKEWVKQAARNGFFGGGLYQNMGKMGDKFVDYSDFKSPPDDMWGEGEPGNLYDCVGLSIQNDNSMKLKTMNCKFPASSLCVSNDTPRK